MNKLKLDYTCTDPDCSQYRAKISNTRYSFIEYREWFGNYIVCHAVVDLQDYSLDEICRYCSAYYDSLEQMRIMVFVARSPSWRNAFSSL